MQLCSAVGPRACALARWGPFGDAIEHRIATRKQPSTENIAIQTQRCHRPSRKDGTVACACVDTPGGVDIDAKRGVAAPKSQGPDCRDRRVMGFEDRQTEGGHLGQLSAQRPMDRLRDSTACIQLDLLGWIIPVYGVAQVQSSTHQSG